MTSPPGGTGDRVGVRLTDPDRQVLAVVLDVIDGEAVLALPAGVSRGPEDIRYPTSIGDVILARAPLSECETEPEDGEWLEVWKCG